MRVLILGGSTAGASVVAQLRRQSETCQITLIERSPYLATAYCGLAYAAGGVVRSDPDYLRPLRPESLAARFNAEVLTQHEVLSIDRLGHTVRVRGRDGDERVLPYDKLVYALGAHSVLPNVPGAAGTPGVFTLRTTEDLAEILAYIGTARPESVVVVGGGFIGLELAESFRHRGLAVTLVERGSQLMAGKLDPDMAGLLLATLESNAVDVRLDDGVMALHRAPMGGPLTIGTQRDTLLAGMAVFAAGIRPNVRLAQDAGLLLGDTGAVQVNRQMQTNDPDIFALGDVAEIPCHVSGNPVHVPLAGPLARQAKILAASLVGKDARYPGTLGTFVCKVFDQTVASTGMTETQVRRAGLSYHRILVPATNHVYFYPGVQQMMLKVLFTPDGDLLGAQVVGGEGSDKRIDVLATALAAGMNVRDLEFLELAYAPPYGAPRDPINFVGSLAAARLDGDISLLHPDELKTENIGEYVLVDIRSADEFEVSGLAGALHIPAEELRARIDEIPQGCVVVVYCASGAKGVSAQRMLAASGRVGYNLMGGMLLLRGLGLQRTDAAPLEQPPCHEATQGSELPPVDDELDLRGLVCPGPLVGARKYLSGVWDGRTVRILTTDRGFCDDFQRLAPRLGVTIEGRGKQPNGDDWVTVTVSK